MKNVSVICAIVKNEQRFIREWVEHYLSIGFDKLYVYEDYGSESHEEQVKDYIEQGKVELVNLDKANIFPHYSKGTRVQVVLYKTFLQRCKEEKLADWCGFFDIDEFMMFEDGWNLKKIEDTFKDNGGILLPWKCYGANGHIKRPIGGVVESYTSFMPEGFLIDPGSSMWNIKSLVNVHKCDGLLNIHIFKDAVFTDGTKFEVGKMLFEKAWINHYFTKSWEDYLERIFSRGNMQNNYRCLDLFFKCNPEFADKRKEMIYAERFRHCASTMWISHKEKLISGGNERKIRELNNKLQKNYARV